MWHSNLSWCHAIHLKIIKKSSSMLSINAMRWFSIPCNTFILMFALLACVLEDFTWAGPERRRPPIAYIEHSLDGIFFSPMMVHLVLCTLNGFESLCKLWNRGRKENVWKILIKERETGIYVSCWLSFFHNKLSISRRGRIRDYYLERYWCQEHRLPWRLLLCSSGRR